MYLAKLDSKQLKTKAHYQRCIPFLFGTRDLNKRKKGKKE